jgi:ABC-type proline/glycine betaine transport system permease subunit
MVAIAQSVFSNKLIQGINANVPGVDPNMVISAGATDLRNNLTSVQYTEVVNIFMNSLRQAFIIPIALTGIAFFVGLLLNKDMRKTGGLKLVV